MSNRLMNPLLFVVLSFVLLCAAFLYLAVVARFLSASFDHVAVLTLVGIGVGEYSSKLVKKIEG